MTTNRRNVRGAWWCCVIAVFIAWVQPVHAHMLRGESIGFSSGFEHPISGWDHIIAMVAVGLWGAQLGSPALWLLPVTFPLIMAVGGFLGLAGVPLPGVETGIAFSALFLGVMVLGSLRPPLFVAVTMVGIFGLFHGYAHGTELPEGGNAVLYSLGFVVATGVLHGIGICIGLIHRWPFGRVTLRVAGAVIAAGGLFFLWRAIQPEEQPSPEDSGAFVAPTRSGNATA